MRVDSPLGKRKYRTLENSRSGVSYLRNVGCNTAQLFDEVVASDLLVVYYAKYDRIPYERTKLLGEIQRECGFSILRLVIYSEIRVQANRAEGHGEIFHQHRIYEG